MNIFVNTDHGYINSSLITCINPDYRNDVARVTFTENGNTETATSRETYLADKLNDAMCSTVLQSPAGFTVATFDTDPPHDGPWIEVVLAWRVSSDPDFPPTPITSTGDVAGEFYAIIDPLGKIKGSHEGGFFESIEAFKVEFAKRYAANERNRVRRAEIAAKKLAK